MDICYHANNKKKVGVAIVILDKVDFRAKSITKCKKGHFIMINGTIFQKNTKNLMFIEFFKAQEAKKNC